MRNPAFITAIYIYIYMLKFVHLASSNSKEGHGGGGAGGKLEFPSFLEIAVPAAKSPIGVEL